MKISLEKTGAVKMQWKKKSLPSVTEAAPSHLSIFPLFLISFLSGGQCTNRHAQRNEARGGERRGKEGHGVAASGRGRGELVAASLVYRVEA